ncbi:MAG: hypothetical protein HY231_03580 [Acidobacteria bacterium]|nr:hypothetical protein [Acidobacteriota bacterium]
MNFKTEAQKKVYEKMREYLFTLFGEVNVTTMAEALAFRPSHQSQQGVRYFLRRLKTDGLTKSEAEELQCFGEWEHLMQLVKAHAHLYAKGR